MNDILYHYCSAETALAIIGSRSVHLSALSQSNDRLEGQWALSMLVAKLTDTGIPKLQIEAVRKFIGLWLDANITLGFCMSKNGDLLSQWRGYADNGRGVAIGFSKATLQASTASNAKGLLRLYDVQYKDGVCSETLNRGSEKIYDLHRNNQLETALSTLVVGKSLSPGSPEAAQLHLVALHVAQCSFAMKNPAFVEENEVRLVTSARVWGQTTETADLVLDECKFRSSGNRLVPFVSHPIGLDTLAGIVLGPRHETPPSIFQSYLRSVGCNTGVTVSTASYRSG
jgi:Protein of unknown function (DUF2971)